MKTNVASILLPVTAVTGVGYFVGWIFEKSTFQSIDLIINLPL